MSYSLEDKVRARELFVESGYTYDEVAAETGISTSVLKAWGKDQKWTEERLEFEQDVMTIRARIRKSAVKAAKDLEDNPTDQKAFAVLKLVEAAFKSKAPSVDKAAYFLETMNKLVAYIKERDSDALRYLEPHIQGFAETMKAAQ